MKKRVLLLVGFLSLFLFIGNVKANSINSINMDIYIDESGDAIVKEIWDYNSDKNTEIYHAYPNLGDSTITDLKVSDSTGKEYTYVEDWNINGSFSDKAYKYGYNYADDGVELCFGISHYGHYKYTLTYKIKGFVYNLNDSQMAYWTLLQPTSENLKNYYIKIHADKEFSDDLPVWGYGKYGAYAYVYDGYIELTTDDAVGSDEYVTVLVKFDKDTFKTDYSLDNDFDEILEMSKEGSTPFVQKESIFAKIFSIVFTILSYIIVPLIFIILATKSGLFNKEKIKNKVIPKGDIPLFRDLPFKDDIFMAYFVSSEYKLLKKETDFLGAILLKWIKEDIVSVTTEEKGVFKTNSTKIIIPKEPTSINFSTIDEKNMYEMMYTAAKDGVLEQKEFNKYCSNHYSKVLNWFSDVIDHEFEIIKNTDYVMQDEKKKRVYNATDKLNEKAMYMAGLKRFFKSFGAIADKSAIEVKMWREYLMYAQIFGIADQVAKEFKKLYPTEIIDQDIDNVILISTFSSTGVSAASAARSRAESYSSGGGGFSSGGGGGGSFGGGGSMGSR